MARGGGLGGSGPYGEIVESDHVLSEAFAAIRRIYENATSKDGTCQLCPPFSHPALQEARSSLVCRKVLGRNTQSTARIQ